MAARKLTARQKTLKIDSENSKAKDKLPTGKAKIEVQTSYVERKPATWS
jgi:hypothetical protein